MGQSDFFDVPLPRWDQFMGVIEDATDELREAMREARECPDRAAAGQRFTQIARAADELLIEMQDLRLHIMRKAGALL